MFIANNKSSPFIVFRFSFLHFSHALFLSHLLFFLLYSLVMKLINSETHSCTISLASFAIFALSGSAFFIIRLIFAIGRNLQSPFISLLLFYLPIMLLTSARFLALHFPKISQIFNFYPQKIIISSFFLFSFYFA